MSADDFRDRFTEEEWALYEAGLCSWVVEYGNGGGIVHCGQALRPGRGVRDCAEHEADRLDYEAEVAR
jgi:hypothetical protein